MGWNRAEYEGLGVDYDEATRRLEEQIDVLRLLWTEPLVSFEGSFHHLDRVGINPLPTRTIPIYVGSGGADPVAAPRRAQGRRLDAAAHPRPRQGRRWPRPWCGCASCARRPAAIRRRSRSTGVSTSARAGSARSSEALELGFADLSFGFNRMANPGLTHDEHLAAVIAAKPELDRLVA